MWKNVINMFGLKVVNQFRQQLLFFVFVFLILNLKILNCEFLSPTHYIYF